MNAACCTLPDGPEPDTALILHYFAEPKMLGAYPRRMSSDSNAGDPEALALAMKEPQCFSHYLRIRILLSAIVVRPHAMQAASNDACQQMLSCSSCDCM